MVGEVIVLDGSKADEAADVFFGLKFEERVAEGGGADEVGLDFDVLKSWRGLGLFVRRVAGDAGDDGKR